MRRLESQTAGIVSMIAALLVPGWWILPQVLAGLGAVSVVSAGCLLWLQRLQPLLVCVAIFTLAYEAWLVWRRPPHRRTRTMLVILWVSVGTTLAIGAGLLALSLRYR